MNQRQAGNVLRRNAPKGEHPAFINKQEASWLKGMGGSGRPTKSGLRSYAEKTGNPFEDSMDRNFNPGLAFDQAKDHVNKLTADTAEGQDMRAKNHEAFQAQAMANTDRKSGMGGNQDAFPNIQNPLSGGMQTRNNTSSSISEIDKPAHEFRKKVFDKSGEIMDREYQSYGDATGEKRFADASQDTLDAQQDVRNMQGQGKQAYQDASDVGKDVSGYQAEQVGGGNFLQGQAVGDYMSPHTSNVIGGLQDQAMKSMQMGRNQLGAQAQMAGAGMGSRSAIEKGVMAGEVMSNLNRQTGELLDKSFADASAQKRADMQMNQDAQKYNQQAGMQAQDVRLRGARGMTDATGAGRQAGYQDAQMLSKVGADLEGRDQRERDFAYDEHIEGRDWDKNNAMFASNVLSGAPVGTTTTQTNPQYRNQQGGRLGRALAGAGAGWLGGGPYGALAGGAMGYFS